MTTPMPNPDEMGPSEKQIYDLNQTVIYGSELSFDRLMDPEMQATPEDQMRYLITLVGALQAAALGLARTIDGLREGMVEMFERLNRLDDGG